MYPYIHPAQIMRMANSPQMKAASAAAAAAMAANPFASVCVIAVMVAVIYYTDDPLAPPHPHGAAFRRQQRNE
jgi:uncharacterized protein (DUF2062 family)